MIIEFPKQPTTKPESPVVAKIKRAILRELADDYLHSIEEIARAIESDRATVVAALLELKRDGKVSTLRRRWSRI